MLIVLTHRRAFYQDPQFLSVIEFFEPGDVVLLISSKTQTMFGSSRTVDAHLFLTKRGLMTTAGFPK